MNKIITLKKNKEFNRLYSKGKSYVSKSLILYVLPNRSYEKRIGITTSKKIGKAVDRNRARRVIKESYRKVLENIKPGYDLVFVARKKTTLIKSTKVLSAMKEQLKEAGIFIS